jgi:hypothetical protein
MLWRPKSRKSSCPPRSSIASDQETKSPSTKEPPRVPPVAAPVEVSQNHFNNGGVRDPLDINYTYISMTH